MQFTVWLAAIVVAVTVWALVKRYETRLVLVTAGLVLATLSLSPMDALNAFAKSMTNGSLIMAICGAMGFAYVISYTR
ncbi:MAG: C4-dicarboxylate ABC transporter, partial [Burkholderiaceae bacterium]